MSTPNEIQLFFHCGKCLEELPPNTNPQEWGALEVGWTSAGVQVWCKRHDINVMHLDFEGQKVSYKEGSIN
jgi:hypothetical protein